MLVDPDEITSDGHTVELAVSVAAYTCEPLVCLKVPDGGAGTGGVVTFTPTTALAGEITSVDIACDRVHGNVIGHHHPAVRKGLAVYDVERLAVEMVDGHG